MRAEVANRYNKLLGDACLTPNLIDGNTSAWAQYTVKIEDRDKLQSELKSFGIPSVVYYPIPLNKQTGYKHYPSATAELENSEKLSKVVISLPMHPYLDEETQDTIIKALQDVLINENSKAA